MKTLLLSFSLCLQVLLVFAQEQEVRRWEKPDFDMMKMDMNDKSSPYYYPSLLQRYRDNDSSLNIQDYRYLYYGSSLQEDYNSYGSSKWSDDIKKLKEKKSLSGKQQQKLIELEEKSLEENPFSLRQLFALSTIYHDNGDSVNARPVDRKLVGIAKAILSTGDGPTDTTAMYVISVADEYDMLRLMGYKSRSQSLLNRNGSSFDYLELSDNEDHIKGMYFNVDRIFAGYKKLFGK